MYQARVESVANRRKAAAVEQHYAKHSPSLQLCAANRDKILNGPVRPHPNVALLRSQVAKVNANVALYSQPPAPIDWAAYKSKM
jgi:hypothetical protein